MHAYDNFMHVDARKNLNEITCRRNEFTLKDIWHGTALKPLGASNRFFSSPSNIALSLSTDGVSAAVK